MESIINGKRYDTRTAERVIDGPLNEGVYRTSKGAWFKANVPFRGLPPIVLLSEAEARDLVGKCAAHRYVEFFGEVEEA